MVKTYDLTVEEAQTAFKAWDLDRSEGITADEYERMMGDVSQKCCSKIGGLKSVAELKPHLARCKHCAQHSPKAKRNHTVTRSGASTSEMD